MHLLESGVDLTVIQRWLGHVQIATTHRYVEIDLEMKRKALAACAPPGEPADSLQRGDGFQPGRDPLVGVAIGAPLGHYVE